MRGHRGREGAAGQLPAATARCGSGIPRPASSVPCWKATRDWVMRVCAVTVAGKELLASGGDGGTVRIWDPGTGQQRAVLEGHQGWRLLRVRGHRGRDGAAGQRGSDGTVRIWDPGPASSAPPWKATRTASGRCARSPWPAESCWPAPARRHGPDLGPANRPAACHAGGHRGGVWSVCPVTVAGQELLASAGERPDGADLGP